MMKIMMVLVVVATDDADVVVVSCFCCIIVDNGDDDDDYDDMVVLAHLSRQAHKVTYSIPLLRSTLSSLSSSSSTMFKHLL